MIPVKFDERTFARLAGMAEAQGVTIGRLIEDAAQRLITGSTTAAYSAEKHRTALIAPSDPTAQEGLDGRADRPRSRLLEIASLTAPHRERHEDIQGPQRAESRTSMSTLVIYGSSDDLVEVDGEYVEEFDAYAPWRGRVIAPDGQSLIVTAEFSKDGEDYWTLGVETAGTWPAWDIHFAEAPREGDPAIVMDVPAGTIVEEISR